MLAMTQQTVHSIDLPTGVRLEYAEQGDEQGAPVVFLHGITDSWRTYQPLLAQLPPSIHVFALTQRGHGDSSRPEFGYEPKDFAADVADFLDAEGVAKVVIVGHSMGSFVAQRFAIDYPQKTAGVVLIGSFAGFGDNPAVQEFYESGVATLRDPIDREFVHEFQASCAARPIPSGFLDQVVDESLKTPARVWKAAFTGLIDKDHTPELGKIKAPTLIVFGDQDVFVPRGDQDVLSSGIAGSKLLIYEGTGHTPQWEEPERLARDIVEFVTGAAP
jgi:pimeloyl-ACP methyl ester carboxylesterase